MGARVRSFCNGIHRQDAKNAKNAKKDEGLNL